MKQSDAARILLVLLGITACSTLMLVLWCSNHIDELDVRMPATNRPVPHHEAQKRSNASKTSSNINILLQMIKERILHLEERRRRSVTNCLNASDSDSSSQYVDVLDVMQRAAQSLAVPVSYSNEFEVVPFTRFTLSRVYPVDPGLGRRVVEKPIGYRKQEMRNVIEHAARIITEQTGQKLSASDFIEGIYRVVPGTGTQYELYFHDRMQYRRVVVALPNPLPLVISNEMVPVRKEMVHIIIALSQRVNAFQQFLQRFKQLVARDDNVDLTVVYFGQADREKVRSLVREFNADQKGKDIVHLLTSAAVFSRGNGLQIGADSFQNNSVLFMCDVDIVFTGSFLERCRLHASQGYSVYYPIVFSLYNPAVAAKLTHSTRPPDKPEIARDAGFWRDFGYGMTCQYQSDFLDVGGFRDEAASNQTTTGWGLEDVRLYRKHLNSGRVNVVRATDPGIFHIWHEKSCPRNLSEDQYKGCLRSRALSEASHAQLGLLMLQRSSKQRHKQLPYQVAL